MLSHYLKIAFRNIWKYKSQSIISIVGLAIGFACFALSVYWIRYERSFDSFHKNANRIYQLRQATGLGFDIDVTPYMSNFLKETFPEVEDACAIQQYRWVRFEIEPKTEFKSVTVDTSFLNIFGFSRNKIQLASYPTYTSDQDRIKIDKYEAIITQEAAQKLFGNQASVVGEKLKDDLDRNFEIKYCVDAWPENTMLSFDIIHTGQFQSGTSKSEYYSYVMLHPHVNPVDFEKKLTEYDNKKHNWKLIPITEIKYKSERSQYGYVRVFAIAGLLVILCSIFNCFALFITRIKQRIPEFAIRIVNGASGWQLTFQLALEFIFTLLISITLGTLLVYFIIPVYREISLIKLTHLDIFMDILTYGGIVLAGIGILALFILQYYKNKSLREFIQGSKPQAKFSFSKVAILIQLAVSIGFIFFTICMLKQIDTLRNGRNLGYNPHNMSGFWIPEFLEEMSVLEKLKQIPTVTDAVIDPSFKGEITGTLSSREEKNKEPIPAEWKSANAHYFNFLEVTFLQGRNFSEDEALNIGKVVVNEEAAKFFGEKNVLDQIIGDSHQIIGVIKDMNYGESPKIKIRPTVYFYKKGSKDFLFRYKEHTKEETEKAITSFLKEKDPYSNIVSFQDRNKMFNDSCKSETLLSRLIGILSGVCVLISIFGIYSMTSLVCQQRRKEIAIRKINGASVSEILSIFFRENLTLLTLASVIGFAAGYKIVKDWIEVYARQTEISWWIYLSIFAVLAIIIFLTIIIHVWKAAHENPAEVIKSE